MVGWKMRGPSRAQLSRRWGERGTGSGSGQRQADQARYERAGIGCVGQEVNGDSARQAARGDGGCDQGLIDAAPKLQLTDLPRHIADSGRVRTSAGGPGEYWHSADGSAWLLGTQVEPITVGVFDSAEGFAGIDGSRWDRPQDIAVSG